MKASERERPRPQAAERLLLLLKMHGPQTAQDLGNDLGVTAEAARQQLGKLLDEGLVCTFTEARGVGRPSQVWRLTDEGHARFPDRHADLAVQLIEAVRTTLGEEALYELIAAREARMRAEYEEELAGSRSLRERVTRLAVLRTREGYMAECKREGEGFLLVENHCPICAAAAACQGFCGSELRTFAAVIGEGASVTRLENIVEGGRRCAYRVQPLTTLRPRRRVKRRPRF